VSRSPFLTKTNRFNISNKSHSYIFIIGRDIPGIHELTFHSIMKCDPDCLKELSSNIILSGGSTIYQGMIERLTKEVANSKIYINSKINFILVMFIGPQFNPLQSNRPS
jgi:actin-related protein